MKIVVSKKDPASRNIARHLKSPYLEIDELHIYTKKFENEKEIIIFPSMHKSKEKINALTIHPVGNYGNAKYGGKDKTLVGTNSFMMKSGLLKIKELSEKEGLEWEVTMEVTHHGPYTGKAIFVEIGSDEEAWENEIAGKIQGNVIDYIYEEKEEIMKESFVSSVGIGGNHYARKFTKLMLEKEFAIGHIIPKYALEFFSKETLEEMIKKTEPKVEIVLVDKKGVKNKEKIKEVLEKINIPYEFI